MSKTIFQLGAYGVAVAMLAGCAVGGGQNGEDRRAVERWHNFDKGQVTAPAENAASVVLLREEGAVQGQSVNVFVNGEYLASLLPGGYKQSIACVGNNRLTPRHTNVRTRYLEKEREGQYFDVPAGQVSYFKVVADASGAPSLQPVDAQTGQELVNNMKVQVHTLPRVDKTPVCAAPVVAPFKTFTLDASALFHFDKSDYANLLPKGKAEIQNVVDQIKAGNANIDRIVVTGYTDPEGAEQYNQGLSERRAATIKRVMGESGLGHQNIVASGKGETNLVVSDCRKRFPNNARQRTLCDQPNRRVEIELYGSMAQPLN